MTTTLTDRYVWTVTRHLPADTGPDVARELRGTIDETVEGRIAAGQDPQTAERETLQDLGDPDVLAREYGGQPGYLISPALYPEYVRLLKLLLVIVLPLALVGVLLARVTTGDQTWIDLVIEALLTVLSVGVHIAFWTTLTFAIIDRTRPESQRDRPLTRWNPDQLPTESPTRRVGLGATIGEVALSLALAALVAWQFGGVGERSAQILNPDLELGWQLAIVGLFGLDAVIAIAAWVMGRWTPALAAVTVAANVGAVILLLWLLAEGRLLADLAAVNDRLGWAVDQSAVTAVIGGAVVIVAVWESIEALIKARRGHRGRLAG
ncbi:permease prefix domain 1-containing protein [Kribbia dieselivorans]|uniref:permease prefix domain 1-containing protein n=1 Tax=Kribbia dieselivorans TaxID=331526 RepID=UPI000838916F|nr:permease prefix domain 1-containing protein [Kribbia dieselivorans]